MSDHTQPEEIEDPPPLPVSEHAHATAKIGGTIIVNGRQFWPSFEFGDNVIDGETDLDLTERVHTIALDGYLNLAIKTRLTITEYEKDNKS